MQVWWKEFIVILPNTKLDKAAELAGEFVWQLKIMCLSWKMSRKNQARRQFPLGRQLDKSMKPSQTY